MAVVVLLVFLVLVIFLVNVVALVRFFVVGFARFVFYVRISHD